MLVAAVISITIITASQLFTDKISRLLDLQASELLAADALVLSNAPINPQFIKRAKELGISVAATTSLRTAIFTENGLQLVELKAVDSLYPLRGHLETKQQAFGDVTKRLHGPKQGELWIDQQIAELITVPTIELGQLDIKPTKILSLEPDRGGSLFNLAPRVMIHMADLDKTELILPGSRVQYYALFASKPELIKQFIDEITPLLSADESIQSLQNARPEMRVALERVRDFFAFGIVMTLVISMSAIALSARYIASLEAKKVAVMRVFGVPQKSLLSYYLKQIWLVWLVALPIGWLFGWLSQIPIEWLLGQWFSNNLPDSGLIAYGMGGLFGAIGLFGFSVPFILVLLKTSPNNVLRSMQWQFEPRQYGMFVSVIAVLALLLFILIQDWKLSLASLIVILLIVSLVPLLIKLLLISIKKMLGSRFWLRGFVISRLLNKQRNALFIMTAFMMTLLSVLLVGVVKDDLFADWQGMLKDDTPNYFAINIQQHEAPKLTKLLDANGLDASNLYPLISARITHINQVALSDLETSHPRAQHFISRVFKISASEQLPDENTIVEGQWPPPKGSASIEISMAEILNIKLNDTVQFDIAGQEFIVTVSSIRTAVWENFKPNFYVLSHVEEIQDLPQTYIMSVFVPDHKKQTLALLHKQFPSVTWLDITQLMARIKQLIDRSALALEFFFIFALLAGIVVLLSSVLASQQQRISEIALLKSFGASRQQIIKSQIAEFALMGAVIGFIASSLASIAGWAVSHFLFNIVYTLNPWLWLIGLGSSILLLSATGLYAVRKTYDSSPMHLLR